MEGEVGYLNALARLGDGKDGGGDGWGGGGWRGR